MIVINVKWISCAYWRHIQQMIDAIDAYKAKAKT